MRLARPVVALALVFVAGCAAPSPPGLADFESPVEILFADASGATSAWTLTLDPPRAGRPDSGVLQATAPAGSPARETLARRVPDAGCRVELGAANGRHFVGLLPHVEDDTLYLDGTLEGDRYCGDVMHASEAGPRKLGSFHATLRKRP